MLRIEEPFHGAVLSHRHGVQDGSGLTITVEGRAPVDRRVMVDGVEARRAGERFFADVTLSAPEQEIVAVMDGTLGRLEHRARVVWDRGSRPRWRFSIDDNVYWLRDVARAGYDSLWDCFYLAMLRDFHERYGAKFTLNIYFEAEDGWLLTEFPERYRAEFAACADWLVLACHAYANEPDRPYQYAPPERLLADIRRVDEQVRRFAGEATVAPPTVIHWGMVVPAALQPLHDYGVRVLSGGFRPGPGGRDIGYFQDTERSEWLSRNEALKDFDSGIVFSNIDLCGNRVPIDEIEPALEALAADPRTAEIMDLFTHEQYFWPFYRNYIPDHRDRLEVMIRWVSERGYEPVLFHEGFLGI